MKTVIPTEILPYLEEIAENLYANHASVMIGAGFSKNAQKGESLKKQSPSWYELGECFYKKIHGKSPNDIDKSYLDVLKLAEEVEAIYGRNTLEKILKSEIPNNELKPSELHTKLLRLPWTDVFTTNYDTLLERAAITIVERRYETVVNRKDLVWSKKPRIVKLHGSFPSDRPFIITEEDYRKYPKEFAPFVNTVQQSLLENTLCLLGFSGDDPNFIKWIGWIRDNLGKENSPKIYLVGLLSLSVGQQRLLEERNIIPVDLSRWGEEGDSHYQVLMAFINFLLNKKKSKDKLDWAKREFNDRIDVKSEVTPQIQKIISKWENARLSYPNWLITPRDQRKILKIVTEYQYSFIHHLEKVEQPYDIKFLYELNWRMERYLMPIFNDWMDIYENVLQKYNPFPKQIESSKDIVSPALENGLKIKDWSDINIYWIELKLSLLRLYREEGFKEKWISLSSEIDKIYSCIPAKLIARYHYEKCLFHLFQLDINALRKELRSWNKDMSIPYWEAKRAMLLAELGDLNEAVRILEDSLKEIREQLYFYPIITDYQLVSQEAYVLQLLKYVNQSLDRRNESSTTKEYTDRLNQLRVYGCDPWGELELFEAYILKGESTSFKSEEINYSFEIGKSTVTRHSSRNMVAEEGYMFMRYIEEIGIALKLPGITFGKNVTQKAISAISDYSSAWAYITLIRTGEKKYIDSVFDRKSMSFMSMEYIENLASNYLNIFDKYANVNIISEYKDDVFATSLRVLIPEILSRLCYKCSYDTRLKILDTLKRIATYDKVNSFFSGIETLKYKVVESFSSEEQWELILMLLEFPIVVDSHNRTPDLFDSLEIENTKSYKSIKIKANIISNLLAAALDFKGKRRIAISRLIKLHTYGLLNRTQTNLFAKNLWAKVDDNGFPVETNYHHVTWMNFPHPPKVDPEQLLRTYINSTPFILQGQEEKKSIPFYQGNIPILINIGFTGKGISNYSWDSEEVNNLILKLKEWWNSDKEYLNKTEIEIFGSIADEFKGRFRHLIKIFSNVIGPYWELVDKINIPIIESIVDDLQNYRFPDLEIKASVLRLYPDKEKKLFENIDEQLCSRNKELIIDAINASIILYENGYDIRCLLNTITYNIKCRTEINLYSFIDGLVAVMKRNKLLPFDEEVFNNLEIGLEKLVDENKVQYYDTQEMVNNKLLVRQSLARLIPLLKKLYLQQNKTVPRYVIEWEEKLTDNNEFVDITNIFIESL